MSMGEIVHLQFGAAQAEAPATPDEICAILTSQIERKLEETGFHARTCSAVASLLAPEISKRMSAFDQHSTMQLKVSVDASAIDPAAVAAAVVDQLRDQFERRLSEVIRLAKYEVAAAAMAAVTVMAHSDQLQPEQ